VSDSVSVTDATHASATKRDECEPPLGRLPVTVLIPAYERAAMLRRALESVMAQRPSLPAEVIVVDDGSRDDTSIVAQEFGVRVIRHPENRGLSAARNTGLRAAGHSWVALLDSDDEWLDHHLSHLWGLRADHVLVAASSLNCGTDPAKDRFRGPLGSRPKVFHDADGFIFPSNPVPVSASMFRRELALDLGGFRPYRGVVEDFDMWLRLLEHGTAICSPTVSIIYHVHDAQMSLSDARRMQLAHIEASEAHRRRTGGSRAPTRRWEGVAGWDNLRAALAAGDLRAAARWAAYIGASPLRMSGTIATWAGRLRVRRRSRHLRRAGVAPARRGAPGSTSTRASV
jgi:GT2 family glycosyltransferase